MNIELDVQSDAQSDVQLVEETIKRVRRIVQNKEKLANELGQSLSDLGQSYMDMRVLLEEIDRLTLTNDKIVKAIENHRDQIGDDRCWLDDLELYNSIGYKDYNDKLPPESEFLASCKRFYQQRQSSMPNPPVDCMTIRQMTNRIKELEAKLN